MSGTPPSPADRIKNTPVITIAQIAQILSRSTNRRFGRPYGLKNADFQILLNLPDRGEVTIGELSRRARLDKAWISRSLGALSDRGLIEIRVSPDRPRAKLIGLTNSGSCMLAEIAPQAADHAKLFLAGVDIATANAILSLILKNAVDLEEADLTAERTMSNVPKEDRSRC